LLCPTEELPPAEQGDESGSELLNNRLLSGPEAPHCDAAARVSSDRRGRR
jgi:hypothetical protein